MNICIHSPRHRPGSVHGSLAILGRRAYIRLQMRPSTAEKYVAALSHQDMFTHLVHIGACATHLPTEDASTRATSKAGAQLRPYAVSAQSTCELIQIGVVKRSQSCLSARYIYEAKARRQDQLVLFCGCTAQKHEAKSTSIRKSSGISTASFPFSLEASPLANFGENAGQKIRLKQHEDGSEDISECCTTWIFKHVGKAIEKIGRRVCCIERTGEDEVHRRHPKLK
ncbi:hypothetical protein C8R45DRAFT_921956 [Mycena sanguinolenta]|nr:hypothetical protein C8R45DRAFT_921956 [Mycena sanguinolenta]